MSLPSSGASLAPAAPPDLPVTGDAAVDEALELLRGLAPGGQGGAGDRGDAAAVLAEVHDRLQRRLSATPG